MDLWVGNGVEQPPLFFIGKDELPQLLPVNLPILKKDIWPEVVHDAGIGRGVGLHNCSRKASRIQYMSIK